jgi:PAS domain S-box-containing protein
MEAKKINILLVDDYPANLVALGAVLSDPAFYIVEATSGPEALAALKLHKIALILLDIQMPHMDGYEVAKRIRSDPYTRDIPIIFITAVHREEASVLRGYDAGAQDYIGKPFDPKVLLAKVGVYSKLFLKASILEEKTIQLAESEERYRLIVEGASDIMATLDHAGIITSLNFAFETLTGLKVQDWIGKSFFPLLDSKDLKEVLSRFEVKPSRSSIPLVQTHIRTHDQKWIPVEISVQPLERDGKSLGSVGVIRDISARALHLLKSPHLK